MFPRVSSVILVIRLPISCVSSMAISGHVHVQTRSIIVAITILFRYTKRVRPSRYGYSAKSITRALSCLGLQNHLCWQRVPAYSALPNWHVDVPAAGVGQSHHYKPCHFDRYLRRHGVCHRMMTAGGGDGVAVDRSALRFGDQLARAVADKLLQLDLAVPPD